MHDDQGKLIYYIHSEEMLWISNPWGGFNDAFYDLNMSMFEQYLTENNISH
jgi:hypothetical protein